MLKKVLVFAVLAALAVAARPSMAASPDEAERFVQTLADGAIATAADKALSQDERDARFRRLFVSGFDLPEIGRFVVGRAWAAAAPEERDEFLRLFEDVSVMTWSRRFRDYRGERLKVAAAAASDGVWVVESSVARSGGQDIPVTWRLKETEGGLKVVDISVEGVSLAITHRSDYAAAIRSGGGKLEALLSVLRQKIEQMRAAG
jgi:phospholipid transport system substrate-binding protein